MAKKPEPDAAAVAVPRPPKPVVAVEYNGTLYPSFEKAEGARTKSDLTLLLTPSSQFFSSGYDQFSSFIRHGEANTIDRVVENAERVHGILSRYLEAKKIEMPPTA